MVGSETGISGITRAQYTWRTAGTVGKNRSDQIQSGQIQSGMTSFATQTFESAKTDLANQNALLHFNRLPEELKKDLVYEGRPISEFSPQEAADLISEDGYFGVAKTSARISDFVIKLAGDDPEKLRVGRDAVLRGFKEAEKQWGGQLPDISYETLDKTLAAIDDKINDAGGSVVDLTA